MTRPDFYWATKEAREFLGKGYFSEAVEVRVDEIARHAAKILANGWKDAPSTWEGDVRTRIYTALAKGYFSLSSPIWSNFGRKGLPISCNGVYIGDSIASILNKAGEVGTQSKYGAGTSGYFGAIRPRGSTISDGGVADGPVHFLEIFDTVTNVISQGTTRRGSFAAYLDVEHPDIREWLTLRDAGHTIQDVSFAVSIGDAWMRSMLAGDRDKQEVWLAIIRKRFESGYPYIFWKDTVNRGRPQVYKDKGLTVWASNLCAEIALPASEEESFVCDLLSMNLETYEEWKYGDAVSTAVLLLDAVMSEYIDKTATIPHMAASHRFAQRHRAIGIGALGYHSLLQKKGYPFESEEARELNRAIHQTVYDQASRMSRWMAVNFGEPELLQGYGQRHTTLMAIAPTTSSSFILGAVSPSVEPLASNYFTKDLAKGKYTYKNPYLTEVLERHGRNNEDVWRSILLHGGSVQHLTWLSEQERAIFKTFGEISQLEIVLQAAERQRYIDQSQSINLTIHPATPVSDVHTLLVTAWQLGVKTLYYQRSTNPSQELVRELLTCSACES